MSPSFRESGGQKAELDMLKGVEVEGKHWGISRFVPKLLDRSSALIALFVHILQLI